MSFARQNSSCKTIRCSKRQTLANASAGSASETVHPIWNERFFEKCKEENVFVAKRNLVDYIWKSANLEGIAVTFPETEAIYNGLNVQR